MGPLRGALQHQISALTVVASQAEAREYAVRTPAGAAIVRRGTDRSVVFACPCSCGEVLTVNLDQRVGAYWRHRVDDFGLTLMPSVARTTGCRSHFIVWRSRILWCRLDLDDVEWPDGVDEELWVERQRIRRDWLAQRRLPPRQS